MVTVRVVEGTAPPAEWGELAAGGPLAVDPAWLRSVAARAQGPGRWFIADDEGGTPVLGLFGVVAETARTDDAFNLYDVVTGAPRTVPLTDEARADRERLRAEAPAAEQWFPNLVLSLPSAECVPVGPSRHDPAAMAALVDGIVQWSDEQSMAAVAALYVRRDHGALAAALRDRGFVAFALGATAELHLPGRSFDDYLASLSKNRRRSARKELDAIAAAGVVVDRDDLAGRVDDLVELRLALKRKYGRTPNPAKERASFTALLDEFAPDALHLLVARGERDGKLIGFGLDVIHNGVWHGIVNGTDYDDPRSDSVAFALDYYEPIRRAYDMGIGVVQLGMAAWEAKRNRGCNLEPVHGYVLPRRDELAPTIEASAAATTVRFP